MSSRTDQIKSELQGNRDALRANFEELENKAKSVIDWKRHFAKHRGAMLAAALAAGALLGTLSARRRGGQPGALPSGEPDPALRPSRPADRAQRHAARRALDPLLDALIGVAVSRAAAYLDQALSGFKQGPERGKAANDAPARSAGEPEDLDPAQGEEGVEGKRRHRSAARESIMATGIGRASPQEPQVADDAASHKRARPA